MKNMTAIRIGFVLGLALVAAGCDTTNQPKKQGSYAAARRMQVGSNIPQPVSASSTGDTALSGGDLDRMSQQQSRMNAGNIGGR